MRPALVVVAVVACRGGDKPKPAPPEPVPAVDAVVVTTDAAPIEWRGPNLYTLDDGDVTVAVTLKPPGTWKEDWTEDHELLTSPAGSTMQVTLVHGDPPPGFGEIRPGVLHQGTGAKAVTLHRVTFPTGTWYARCELALVDADAALVSELAAQCDDLDLQQEPDPRIAWTISVKPATVKLAKVGTVTVRYTATNKSTAPIDAKAYSLEYWIDGADSSMLGMAFGNGGFSSIWTELPPGKTVDDERVGMDDLVDKPGDHVLSLRHLDHEVARATLHVK
jgi:hypothetical protein